MEQVRNSRTGEYTFGHVVRNLDAELVRRIKDGKLSEEEKRDFKIKAAVEAYARESGQS